MLATLSSLSLNAGGSDRPYWACFASLTDISSRPWLPGDSSYALLSFLTLRTHRPWLSWQALWPFWATITDSAILASETLETSWPLGPRFAS